MNNHEERTEKNAMCEISPRFGDLPLSPGYGLKKKIFGSLRLCVSLIQTANKPR